MSKCHNMKTTVQNTCGYAYSIRSKIKTPNKTLYNITTALLLNSIHKKEIWCFAYQYTIWRSRLTDNGLRGDVHYLICNGSIPSYKHIKIWGMRAYIIKGHVTRKKRDNISHCSYFMVYVYTTGVILYWNRTRILLST